MSQNVSKEIEDEANSYFQRIYNHPPHPTLSIDEVLEMLKKFQHSPNKRERVRNTFICNCLDFMQMNAIKSCMNFLFWAESLNWYVHNSEVVIPVVFWLWLNICCDSANLMFSQCCS
jgi:hypothetical protein